MGGFGTFLVALAAPAVKRALIALGIGVVSYGAVSVALASALTAARSAWGGLGGEALQLVQLAGVNTAASIMAGALIARVGLQFTKRLGMVV